MSYHRITQTPRTDGQKYQIQILFSKQHDVIDKHRGRHFDILNMVTTVCG